MYYTYLHKRLDNNEIFYVGIGKVYEGKNDFETYQRAYQTYSRNKFWKFLTSKTNYTVIIDKKFEDRKECEEREIELISKYGRRDLNKGTLVNLTDGGEGLKGCRPKNARKVYQYDLKGNFIKVFDTIQQAEKEVNCTNISGCCRGVVRTAGKYQWSYTKSKMKEVRYHTSEERSKKVLQFNKDGILINEFESVQEASKFISNSIVGSSSISNCCNNKKLKTYKGFIWKFK
jgi:hypothetical protein